MSVVCLHLSELQQVIRARVPLIAFVDSQTGVAVDISVSNHGGTFKSIFTRELCQFDSRFVSLYRLVSWEHSPRTWRLAGIVCTSWVTCQLLGLVLCWILPLAVVTLWLVDWLATACARCGAGQALGRNARPQ